MWIKKERRRRKKVEVANGATRVRIIDNSGGIEGQKGERREREK